MAGTIRGNTGVGCSITTSRGIVGRCSPRCVVITANNGTVGPGTFSGRGIMAMASVLGNNIGLSNGGIYIVNSNVAKLRASRLLISRKGGISIVRVTSGVTPNT